MAFTATARLSRPLPRVNEVPDLRVLGMRIAQCVSALGLGLVSAFEIAMLLPQGNGREASAFAPLFLMLGMGGGFAVGWYALFEAVRRSRSHPCALRLPVARVRPRGYLTML